MIGRCNGGKQFVKPHNIYISKEMYDDIKKIIQYSIDLVKSKSGSPAVTKGNRPDLLFSFNWDIHNSILPDESNFKLPLKSN